MKPISLDDVRARHDVDAERFREFFRVNALSVGRYVLPAGGTDSQTPHTEDEIYYVLHGRARIDIDDEFHSVEPGEVIYVERGTEHRFVDIEARLELLVVFAPAEGSLAGSA